jgi:hypothetical protein
VGLLEILRPGHAPGTPRTPARPASIQLPDPPGGDLHVGRPNDGGPHNGWIPAGTGVEVAGLTLPGGMLYVGTELPARAGGCPDPALIDPRLPVDLRQPSRHFPVDDSPADVRTDDWPSYATMSPQARGSYLNWLAGGRSGPDAAISWVFLFFYGLERRLIVDAGQEPALRDWPLIAAEVRRLLDLHSGRSSFDSYATQFLALLDVLSSPPDLAGGAPPRTVSRGLVPHQLRAGLGRLAAEGRPVPADWALSWAHFHPSIYPRTPAQRCPAEFEQLFRARYLARHGEGLRVRPGKTMLWHTYMAANPGIGHVAIPLSLPDVLELAAPTRQLRLLAEECADALGAYSRYLGRHPGAKGTLEAAARLPPELADGTQGDLSRLIAWVDGQLGQAARAVVDGGDLIALWPGAEADRLARAEAVALARLLGARGVGIEPDVRLGGPTLTAGPAVLFRIAAVRPDPRRAAYPAAAMLSQLAAAVLAADAQVSDAGRALLHARLGSETDLPEPEQARLRAHTEWVLAGQIGLAGLTGLTARLAAPDQVQRGAMADFLVMLAAAERAVSPATITALTRIFRLLGFDPAALYSRIHAATTSLRPATEPVIVRPAAAAAPGYPVSPPPGGAAAGTASVASGTASGNSPLQLDETAIAVKLAETDAVSALLSTIFAEATGGADCAEHAAAPAELAEPAAPGTRRDGPRARETAAGYLDVPHSALLRTLAGQARWTRARLEAECAAVALLPDGALDTLNDAAYETAGDPLTDGDDPIDINQDVAREMLA